MTIASDKALLEALLFASAKPVQAETLREITGIEVKKLRKLLQTMMDEYSSMGRGFTLEEIAGGYQLRSDPRFAESISKLHRVRSRQRFSRSALETLAMVAYRQPITRAEIEHLRGVDSGAVLKTLLAQGVIRIIGRKEAPGRPMLYGTTKEFLEYFGLRDLESLPTLEEVTELLEEHEADRPDKGSEE